MAGTGVIVKRGQTGDWRLVDVTLDASYPAGGYPFTAKDFGFGTNGTILYVAAGGFSKTGGWEAAWDYTNNKLQIFDGSAAANLAEHEVIATTVLTGVVVRLFVIGNGQG